MANRFDPIDKITPMRECWRLKVRVVRMWFLPSYNNADVINSMEMVLMDCCGSKIHASVRKTLIYKFKPLITEGHVYMFSYFGVAGNTGLYRTTRREFRLNFQLRTTVKLCESDDIPLYGLSLVPFEEILQTDGDFPYLLDTMGLLTGFGMEKQYEKDGKTTKMIVIQLEVDNVKLECALFGCYVDEVSSFISTGEVAPPIVVIQFAKVKSFRGKLVLQNVMFATRLLFNPSIPEVVEFRHNLTVMNSSQSLSLLSDDKSYSVEDDFLHMYSRKTIENLKDCKDDGLYIVFATVKHLTNSSDWWYPACKCNKAVTPDSGMYYCERCYCYVVNVVPRYRIKLRVIDETDSATFVLWDRDATLVLKKSCADMLQLVQKAGGDVVYPAGFDLLLEKSFLFKVEVKTCTSNRFEPSFKVIKLCTDSTIISKFRQSEQTIYGTEPDLTCGLSPAYSKLSQDSKYHQTVVAKPDVSSGFSLADSKFDFKDVQSSADVENCVLYHEESKLSPDSKDFQTKVEKELMSNFCDETNETMVIISTPGNCSPDDEVPKDEFSTSKLKKVKIEKDEHDY